MKALHAGYISGAVWQALNKGDLSPDLDWDDIIGRLSHFVIDQDVGGSGVLSPELCVLENLICRGLPTLPSLYLERCLQRLSRITRCNRQGNKGVAAFECDIDPSVASTALPLIEQALCAISASAECIPSEGFQIAGFDSQAEEEFFKGPLLELLGSAGMQLVFRQRRLDAMGIANPDNFDEQLTDFSIQLPGYKQGLKIGIVFEVDGPHHAQLIVGDRARDRALEQTQWAQTYRQRLWRGVPARSPIGHTHPGVNSILQHPYLLRVKLNSDSPLEASDLGRRARIAALFPFAVSRIQRVLLELLRGGILSLDEPEWNLVIIDRDKLSGCGKAAVIDFCLWIRHLWGLYKPGKLLPKVHVYEVGQGDLVSGLPDEADVILDVSVELRYGMSLPTPDAIHLIRARQRIVIRSDYWKSDPTHQQAFGDPLCLNARDHEAEYHLTFFLKNLFRKVAFRPKQYEIIQRALRNQSVIALLPTGAGKSVTYQLPSLLQNGIAIVVDPLKSLMKDQDDNLKSIGITASAFINSMSTSRERRRSTEQMQKGVFKFVFVSPERFIIREFRAALENMGREGHVYCAYVVVDEAHCVSEWGHDFRTAYLRLGANALRFCPARVEKLPLLGLTGTASYEVLDDVHIELGYSKNSKIAVWPDSMQRINLHYRVVALENAPAIPHGANEMTVKQLAGNAKLNQLPGLVTRLTQELKSLHPSDFFAHNNGSALVFCPHAKWVHGTERASNTLKIAFPVFSDAITLYHGKLDAAGGDPIKIQNDFKSGKVKLLVCTKAFGMGIDKPDIRFTLHFNIPPSLESFYQEAGRAGRDNEDALCWIFYSGIPMGADKPSLDYSINHDFHKNAFPGADLEEAKVMEMLLENRTPGRSVVRTLAEMLYDETGIEYSVNRWVAGNRHRLYINHPEYRADDSQVFIQTSPGQEPVQRAENPFPGHEKVSNLILEWLKENKPAETSLDDWIFSVNEPTVSSTGIEELLGDISESDNSANAIILSFDNGYLEEIADRLGTTPEIVYKAFAFNHHVDDFINALSNERVTDIRENSEWVKAVFKRTRLREHTFRAIYRLTVLGAVSDYEADYKSNTITAWLTPQTDGGYRKKLEEYIERYAPMDVENYLQIADRCSYTTELRRCMHALIAFVYARIAKQRIESLRIMEQTTVRGLTDSEAFTEAVTTFFDSKYIPILRPFLNDYTADMVFQIIGDTAGGTAQVAHLLGACNRLLPENPDNAAFHALRAYALALGGYREQDVMIEIERSLENFEKYKGWGRQEKIGFLMQLRSLIPTASVEHGLARVFDAAIINDHTQWLRDFRSKTIRPSDDLINSGQ